jgi:hypothetical protein
MTLDVDGKWSSLMDEAELAENLTTKLNNCLGFRGHVKKLKLVKPRSKREG